MAIPGDTDEAFAVAVRLLARRSRSEAALGAELAKKGHGPGDIEAVLSRLRRLQYVDDAGLARRHAEAWLGSGRYGAVRVQEKLKALGVPEPLVSRVVAEVEGELAQSAESRARTLLERRHREAARGLSRTERSRDFRFLVGRGFGEEVARRVVGWEDLPDGET